MNRSQARQQVAQLLVWQEAELLEGRCPKCEAIAEDIGAAPAELKPSDVSASG